MSTDPVGAGPRAVSAPAVADEDPRRRTDRWFRWGLLAIVAVAVAIRLVYALGTVADDPVSGDSYYYHHAARLLADGEGMIFPYDLYELGERNEAADHPPLYVLYLAGWSLVGLDSVEAHLVASVLLGGAAVALSGLVGRRVAGPVVGLVAAGLVALYPNLITWDSVLLSEPTGTVTTLLVLLAAYRHLELRTTATAALLGGSIGLATLARPELVLLSLFVAVPAVLGTSHLDRRQRAAQLVLAGTAAVALLAPWVGWNLTRFDEPVVLSTNLGVTLAYTNCDAVYDGPLLGYWEFGCGAYVAGNTEGYGAMDQSERSEVLQEFALEQIDENRGELPKVALARAGRVLGVYDPAGHVDLEVAVERRNRTLATLGMGAWYAVALVGLAGFVVLGRARMVRYPLAAPLLTVVLASVATYGTSRFRASAEPVVCVLAGVALVQLVHVVRQRRARPAPGPQAT
ncbi:MAG TPA: glycosyltransferase family 39 protein [Acidimicrobiales bacterium]|nr:glycosyltransferase family 39 protein [Acidimicrobiales bacterium]